MHKNKVDNMTHQVNSKLLILFGIICTTFLFTESIAHAETIANKSSTFSTQLSNNNITNYDTNDSALAEQIRAQRAARDAADARNINAQQIKSGAIKNNCDTALRKCIESQCGDNYKKCETDSDTTFSGKLNTCRKNTTCTAHEFTAFVSEIKEDKKQAIRLAAYNDVINCGNNYNACIIDACGPTFEKCLGKSDGDRAIAKCKNIATQCAQADSGLAGRIGNIFGIVRTNAEKQIKQDEQKLYQLRKDMRASCNSLGALFDDRSLDCVFTVNFFAGDNHSTPTASKKLYAGSLFDCTPDWFGIDITTFKENAYRATRAQSTASAAVLGSGLGMAVGAVTSGAIDRAVQTQKAKDELEKVCAENGQVMDKNGNCVDAETPDKKAANPAENGGGSDSEQKSNDTKNQENNKNNNQNNTAKDDDTDPFARPNNDGLEIALEILSDIEQRECEQSGGEWNTKKRECECTKPGLIDDSQHPNKCKCMGKDVYQDGKCVKQSK